MFLFMQSGVGIQASLAISLCPETQPMFPFLSVSLDHCHEAIKLALPPEGHGSAAEVLVCLVQGLAFLFRVGVQPAPI
jgi:hypothetical protein